MKRIYDVRPGEGERSWRGQGRLLVCNGGGFETEDGPPQGLLFGELAKVCRVEFDNDADEGPATVTVLLQTKDGRMVRTPDFKGISRASFRCWCRLEMDVNFGVLAAEPHHVVGEVE